MTMNRPPNRDLRDDRGRVPGIGRSVRPPARSSVERPVLTYAQMREHESRGPIPRGSSYEIEVLPGLEEFAMAEVERLPTATAIRRLPKEGRIACEYFDLLETLNELRSVVAVHAVERFDIANPRALLDDGNMARVIRTAMRIVAAHPANTFQSFGISAAGSDSPLFQILKREIGARLRLTNVTGPSDLLLAIRRSVGGTSGWEVLIRTSPRPLSTRQWRVADMPGALNATIAHVMVTLAGPRPDEVFVNLACGSCTLVVERLDLGPARMVIAADLDANALACAKDNLEASGHTREVRLLERDARDLAFSSGAVDTVVADLPYAMLVGKYDDNQNLYPAILMEAARLSAPNGHCLIVTTQHKLMRRILEQSADVWRVERTVPIKLPYRSGYITPSIYHLRREPSP